MLMILIVEKLSYMITMQLESLFDCGKFKMQAK